MADDTAKAATPKPAGPSAEERIAALEKQLAASRAMAPQTTVPTNSGGPGDGNHLESWGLAAQEAANAGEWRDEWGEEPE